MQIIQISSRIELSLPLREQARQAFNMRNEIMTQARRFMADRKLAEQYNRTNPNKTWAQLLKMEADKGYEGCEIYQSILDSSMKSRKSVDDALRK